jgi:ParB family transcriptional regulator, chromosome partitioning protein
MQPRQTFDDERLEELAASLRLEGVLQPIAVRYDDEADRYVIIHGERRWRAARRAGLDSIPAVVRDVPEERRLIQQLMENIVREDLNVIDRAAALRALKSQMHDAPWEQVAEAVGIRRSRLFQLLGTEKLPEAVQQELRAGRLSEKQSRVLQGLPRAAQESLAQLILDDGLPQAAAERIARAVRADPSFAELPLEEIDRRFNAMREALDASAHRAKQRPAPDDHSAALLHLLPEDEFRRLDASVSWCEASRADLEQRIVDLARALRGYQGARIGIDERRSVNEKLRTLQHAIDDVIRSAQRG